MSNALSFYHSRSVISILLVVLYMSFFLDALTVFDFVSVSRFVSIIFCLTSILIIPKHIFLKALKSFILPMVLVMYLWLRSIISGSSPYDSYFVVLFANTALALVVLTSLYYANQPVYILAAIFSGTAFFSCAAVLGYGVEISPQDYRVNFLKLNPNEFASILIFGLVAGLLLLRNLSKDNVFHLFLFCCGLFFILSAIVITGTRFVILSAAILVVLSGLIDGIQKRRFGVGVSLLSTILAVIIFEVWPSYSSDVYNQGSLAQLIQQNSVGTGRSSLLERFDLVTTGINHNISSLGGRVDLWKTAFAAFLSQPLFGLGLHEFEIYSTYQNGYFGRPHNFILEVLAIGGIVGFSIIGLTVNGILKFSFIWNGLQFLFLFVLSLSPFVLIMLMLNINSFKLFWFWFGFVFYLLNHFDIEKKMATTSS